MKPVSIQTSQHPKLATKQPNFLSEHGINIALMFKIMDSQMAMIQQILTGKASSMPGVSEKDKSRAQKNVANASQSISNIASKESGDSDSVSKLLLETLAELNKLRLLKEASFKHPELQGLKKEIQSLESEIQKHIDEIPPGTVLEGTGDLKAIHNFTVILNFLKNAKSTDAIKTFWTENSYNVSGMFFGELEYLAEQQEIDYTDPETLIAIIQIIMTADDTQGETDKTPHGGNIGKILSSNNPALNTTLAKEMAQFLVADIYKKYGNDPNELKFQLYRLRDEFSISSLNGDDPTKTFGHEFYKELAKYAYPSKDGKYTPPPYPYGVYLNQLSFSLEQAFSNLFGW